MNRFLKENPGIRMTIFNLPYNELFERLESREIDIAISFRFRRYPHPDLISRTLERKKIYALVSKDHPAAKCAHGPGQLKYLDDNQLFIIDSSAIPNISSFVISECDRNGIHPSKVRYLDNYATLCNLVIMGRGFTILNKDCQISPKQLSFIPLPESDRVDFCAFCNPRFENPAVRTFFDLI